MVEEEGQRAAPSPGSNMPLLSFRNAFALPHLVDEWVSLPQELYGSTRDYPPGSF